MDSVLKNIGFTDCCVISMATRWNINFFITHVRKVMSFYCNFLRYSFSILIRSSRPEVFLRKDALNICSKFTEEPSCFVTLLKSHFGMGVLQ